MIYPKKLDFKLKNKVLNVGLLNLMPNKQVTIKHWHHVMKMAKIEVEWVYIAMKSHHPKSLESQQYLHQSIGFELVDWHKMDFLIVTGAPVEKFPFNQVDYWEELNQIIHKANQSCPILSVCWGAQAALKVLHNVDKVLFEKKFTGVFEHECIGDFATLGRIDLPHSRFTGWHQQDLLKVKALTPLILLDDQWVCITDEASNLYFSAHPEYEVCTLLDEYRRDLKKGIKDTKPIGYHFESEKECLTGHYWGTKFALALNLWIENIIEMS